MQRPLGVTLTAILMALNIFVDVGHSFQTSSVRTPPIDAGGVTDPHMMLGIHIAVAAVIALECITVLFFFLGYSWARWFVLAGCIFYLIGIRSLRMDYFHSHFIALMDVLQAALSIYLLWYLHTHDVRTWFARRRLAALATGK
jgi:hypothetical protein